MTANIYRASLIFIFCFCLYLVLLILFHLVMSFMPEMLNFNPKIHIKLLSGPPFWNRTVLILFPYPAFFFCLFSCFSQILTESMNIAKTFYTSPRIKKLETIKERQGDGNVPYNDIKCRHSFHIQFEILLALF